MSIQQSEIEKLSRKLVDIEEENDQLKEKMIMNENKFEDEKSPLSEELSEDAKPLGEELGIFGLKAKDLCDPCNFASKDETILSRHKLQELELETEICKQKLKLSSNLFKIGEKEQEEKHYCNCRGFCRINHKKHNWQKSIIQVLQSNFGCVLIDYECKECDQKFQSKEDLKKACRNQPHKNSREEKFFGSIDN